MDEVLAGYTRIRHLATPLLGTFAALAASFFPARRASRVDPLVALRHE